MTRGSIILIEGLDRTGKSTQVDLILQEFSKAGKPARLVKFPERSTAIGKIINEYLVNKSFELPKEAAHLLFSANRWELKDKLLKELENGTTLVMDRYFYLGIAYSTANGLDFDWCKSPDVGLPKPDLTLFLAFKDPENVNRLQNRENYGEERYEVSEFQQSVRKQFERFFNEEEKEKQRESDSKCQFEIIYVDNKSIEEVKQLVMEHVNKYMNGTDEEVELFK